MRRSLSAVVVGLAVGLGCGPRPAPVPALVPAPALVPQPPVPRETAPPPSPAGVREAFAHLAAEHDRFHTRWVVNDDRWSGAAPFAPALRMGALVGLTPRQATKLLDDLCPTDPKEGLTCIRVTLPANLPLTSARWLGFALTSRATDDGKPVGDDNPRVGYDLRPTLAGGVTPALVFWAKGAKGGELVEFKPHSGESPLHPPIHKLARQWTRYELPLDPEYLRKPVTELLVCAASAPYNPDGCTFYVDDVHLALGPTAAKARLAEPRFIRSYVGLTAAPPDEHFRSVAYCYDQALALSAFVARGEPDDLRRAGLIADAFLLLQDRDRHATDGRVRNVACPGDVVEPTWDADRRRARVPGRWDTDVNCWVEDEYFVGSDCGNTAWVILGLLNYWEADGRRADSPHLKAAARLGQWVDKTAFRRDGPGGFAGGRIGFEPNQRLAPWKSTEHNLDLFAAFERLAIATGDKRFRECAAHAKAFVEAMWNADGKHLWTGTRDDGVKVNEKPIPLDVQAWAVLAMREPKRYAPAVEWARKNCRVEAKGGRLIGYDFDTDRDAAWFEGTAQMALAFRLLGQPGEEAEALNAIQEHGRLASVPGAIHAASRDGLTTGFQQDWGPWVYYRRAHVGASSWFLLAALGYNPYWGASAAPPAK